MNCFFDLFSGQFIPGCCYNRGMPIQTIDHLYSCFEFFLFNTIGSGQNNSRSIFDLIIIELSKVLHIDLYFTGINNCNCVTKDNLLIRYLLHCRNNIRKLAYTRRFNNNTVRSIFRKHLLQGFSKIANQAAAYTTGIHFGNINAGIL